MALKKKKGGGGEGKRREREREAGENRTMNYTGKCRCSYDPSSELPRGVVLVLAYMADCPV